MVRRRKNRLFYVVFSLLSPADCYDTTISLRMKLCAVQHRLLLLRLYDDDDGLDAMLRAERGCSVVVFLKSVSSFHVVEEKQRLNILFKNMA